MTPDEIALFKSWGVPLPQREAHGTDDDIRAQLHSAKPKNWHMEGNYLTADTELGKLSQRMPTNLILTGVDDKGLPIFKHL